MPLITTIAQVIEFVKVSYSNAASSLPNQLRAERRFLIPVLGEDLYNNLVANITDDTYDDLLYKCRSVSAPLSYWLELATIQAQITDAGVATFENENKRAAHRWEYEEIKQQLEEDGMYAIEDLLKYLFENAATYNWTPSDEFNIIFKSADDFKKYYPTLSQPYRVFQSMRVLMQQVQDQYMIPLLGEDFFIELRDVASATTEEAKAIVLIKKAVANLTIARAIETLSVRFSNDGFTVLLSSPQEKPAQGQQQAPDNQLRVAMERAGTSGDTYLLQLKEYLNETASDSVFSTYYESDKYTAPSDEEEESPNAGRTGVYGL